jgi:NAD(P)-dependent dehydrogenase (short-subunit alcohol dehydrogenase family)
VRFQDKKIVVIGGSSGMGLATAKMAAAEGAAVYIGGRSEEKLRQARVQIQGKVELISVNVMDEKSVQSFLDKIGEFDHLATPGSEAVLGKLLDLDINAAKKAFDSKFWGQYRAAKYGAPKIREGGSIILFAGIWSQRPILGAAPVAAINSAVEGLGRALAVELAPIRVNTVSPGIVDTPLYSGMEPGKRKTMFQGIAASIPVKRVGRPEDIAQTVLYLMANGYTTGSTLYVDGGATLR